jgi:hypothetical protein
MSVATTVKNWLHTQKDHSVSFLAEGMLRTRLEPYGCLREFKLDSQKNTASFTLLLKGELEPVTVDVQEYGLVEDGHGHYLVVNQVGSSRKWLDALLNDFLVGRRLRIPEKYAHYTKLLL